jgi:hypothetical protein
MKIWISCDMEGVAGIVDWDQCRPGSDGYPLGCALLQDEVNAAIEGALAGGATEFVVNDSHSRMANLDPRKIAGRASYLSGRHKPMYMAEGLDDSFDAVFLVGYHGSISGRPSTLSHTYNPEVFAGVRVNGDYVGESGPLFAAFGNIALDGSHFVARRSIGLLLDLQDFGECLHDFEACVVLVLLQPQVAGLLQGHDQLVGNVGDLIARELHGIAGVAARRAHDLALLHHRVLGFAEHLLIADAFAPHVVAVLLEDVAHFVVQLVFGLEFIRDDGVHEFRDLFRRVRLDRAG